MVKVFWFKSRSLEQKIREIREKDEKSLVEKTNNTKSGTQSHRQNLSVCKVLFSDIWHI